MVCACVIIFSLIIYHDLFQYDHCTKYHKLTVKAENPWEQDTYVPRNSSVHLNCTGSRDNLLWSIKLAGFSSFVRFRRSGPLLRSKGFEELPSETVGDQTTISMSITNTEENNGTLVECVSILDASVISSTTIIVLGKFKVYASLYIFDNY